MKTSACRLAAALVLLLSAATVGQAPLAPISFTVSTPDPASHLYHVVMFAADLPGGVVDFTMPVWTPGYYGKFDYAANVRNFTATSDAGQVLPWEKVGPDTWRVAKGKERAVRVAYDVLAENPFVAAAFLDETRGYITPGALFFYVPGEIHRQVTVTIELHPKWSTVATGLDRLPPGAAERSAPPTKAPWRFAAPDFDVLYDSPILLGNLESLPPFEVDGVPHHFVAHAPGDFDRAQFMADLKAVVESATRIIGDIPYRQYTFLGIGPGRGGIEHAVSTAVPTPSPGKDRAARIRLLSFLAHEYFHHYNVKRIRPIALGPFDYGRENVTSMLWVSEGFTSYYQHIVLARAGLMTLEEVLDQMGRTIAAVENNTGRLFQSVAESSQRSWEQGPFGGRGTGLRKSISYYDKGAILGMLLDFRIRHETRNARSLDTVMRTLYQTFYKDLGRGWTDDEFRQVVERTAGVPLADFFALAETTKEIDYATYLSYAGLEMEPAPQVPDAYLGALFEDLNGKTLVAAVEAGSPAAVAGLVSGEVVEAFDGRRTVASGVSEALSSLRPGGRVTLTVSRGNERRDVTVTLGDKVERSYRLRPMAKRTSLQEAILRSWLEPPPVGATRR
ncbi:MAG: M61 family metallopeptidase [Vicinamibacterales bacterium]